MNSNGRHAHEKWDAIVIGSGPGGLTTAAYLCAAGKQVLVLEQHDIAGGNCQVFRRKEFEFDVGLHYLGDCNPGGTIPSILRGLGLDGTIDFRPFDQDGFDTLIFPDLTFRVPAGWDEYQQRLVDTFRDDRDAIEGVIAVLRGIAEELPLSYLPGAETPNTDKWSKRTLAELFSEFQLSQRPMAVLEHWSGLYGSGPADTGCWMHALIINHYMGGAFYPEGGGQMIPARLVQLIESLGGEVRTLSRVDQILVEDGSVKGVRLTDTTVLESDLVVSNADYKRTVTELTDVSVWSSDTVKWAEASVMTLGLIVTYVIVDKDIVSKIPNTNFFVFSGWDVEEEYAQLEAGKVPDRRPFAYLSLASRKDPHNPHLCGPGQTNMQIMTLAPRGYEVWGVDEGPTHGARYRRSDQYRSRKAEYEDMLINAAEEALGPLRDDIVHLETATPLTQERYTLSSGGTSYGLQFSPGQTGKLRPGYRTEIKGLFVVGANSVSSHGIAGTMIGGLACAGQILDRALVPEVMMGEVLSEPGVIGEDPPDWDPFPVSRGKRLSAIRAEGVEARASTSAD